MKLLLQISRPTTKYQSHASEYVLATITSQHVTHTHTHTHTLSLSLNHTSTPLDGRLRKTDYCTVCCNALLLVQGKEHAKKIKAKGYIECSAREIPSVTAVFVEAVKIVMDKDRRYWSDVHKKAKKEDRLEAKVQKKLDKKRAKDVELSSSTAGES
jgi:hypothetical protein